MRISCDVTYLLVQESHATCVRGTLLKTSPLNRLPSIIKLCFGITATNEVYPKGGYCWFQFTSLASRTSRFERLAAPSGGTLCCCACMAHWVVLVQTSEEFTKREPFVAVALLQLGWGGGTFSLSLCLSVSLFWHYRYQWGSSEVRLLLIQTLARLVGPPGFERLAPPRGNPPLLYLYGSLSCTCTDFRGVFWEESLLLEWQRTSQVPPFRARVWLSFRTGEGRAQLYPNWGGGTLQGTTLSWKGWGDSPGDNPTLKGVGRLSRR